MIIHIGGIFGDKAEAINRFINTCNTRLSERVRRHLIIENDDRLYHVEDVLYIAKHTGLPMVFDNLHNACNPGPSNWSEREILPSVPLRLGPRKMVVQNSLQSTR